MKDELDAKLVKNHPSLLKNRYGDMRHTCMCWGFECGDGWYDILERLFTKLDKIAPERVVIDQVKEKFGGLRVYYTYIGKETWWEAVPGTFYNYVRSLLPNKISNPTIKFLKYIGLKGPYDRVHDAVWKAEAESYKTCEWCGKSGEQSGISGWIRTLCNECQAKSVEGKSPWRNPEEFKD